MRFNRFGQLDRDMFKDRLDEVISIAHVASDERDIHIGVSGNVSMRSKRLGTM